MIRSPVNKSCLFFSGLSKLLVFTVVTFALFSAAAQDTTPPPALSEALAQGLLGDVTEGPKDRDLVAGVFEAVEHGNLGR